MVDTTPLTLRDGVEFESLIDRDERSLSARIFTDPEIFELELRRVFARAWIPVAHVTEIPQPGDFVRRRIGLDSVLVSHGRDPDTDADEYHVVLNACTHRGTQVCRADTGNTHGHRCPYHGWTFAPDGALIGVPFERQMYGTERLDREALALPRARVGVYGGIIFGCWDPEAPSLDDFLGGWKWYADIYMDRTDGGMEVSGPPQRWVIDANWKVVCDGFFGDSYHVLTVHSSFADVGLMPPGDMALHARKVTFGGHTVLCPPHPPHGIEGTPAEVLEKLPPTALSPDLVGEIERKLSPDQMEMLVHSPPSIFGLWPIASLIFIGAGLGGPLGQTSSLRFFSPLTHDKTEMITYSMVERGATQDYKDYVHRTSISNFGIGGIFEPDDVEVWEAVQNGLRGVIGSQGRARYPSRSGEPDADFAGPGNLHSGYSSDDNQWSFYMRWAEFMSGRPWSAQA